MQHSRSNLSAQQLAWLQLSQSPGLGAVALKRLWQAYGSAQAIVSSASSKQRPTPLSTGLSKALSKLTPLAADRIKQLECWLAHPDHHLLCLDDPRYPQQLLQIDDPPPLLYLVGDPQLLNYPQLALVGSRAASAQGLTDARNFARQLSNAGLVPTSGLALGIDGAAHQGAIEGLGLTVAVLGTGVDQVYPARHRRLAEQVVDQGGALVSELPLATPARAQNFPRRNRIISGLSLGVLVVEAALKSGSLISARLAAEQGREVFALPGSIHNPVSQGCHHLIRQGATLVTQPQQIIEELAPQLPVSPPAPIEEGGNQGRTALNADQQQLLSALGWSPVSMDELVVRLQQSVPQLQAQLLELELQGEVRSVAGGFQRC